MLKSPLRPELISRSKGTSLESALKFISGDAPLGSSISSLAANKIVGFNRAQISPKPSGIQSLIETLTTNIFKNNSITNNIFGGNNQSSKGSGLFSFAGGAFDKIKEALAFVSFFGSKKNLNAIRDNIKVLKIVFEETFDIAKELRKAINKIFKTLTGFDGGGGGGGIFGAISSLLGGLLGGLIPGIGRGGVPRGALNAERGLARTARVAAGKPNLLSRIGTSLKGAGKLALVGGGLAATGAAISGLSGPGDSEVAPDQTSPEIPETLLDRFNSILDRFDKILDGLKGGRGPGGGSKGGTGAKGSSSAGSGSGSGGGGITTPPGGFQSSIPTGNEKELLKRLIIAEAGGQGELGMAAVARSVLNRSGLIKSGKTGAGTFGAIGGNVADVISASGQYQPYSQGKLNRVLSAAENTRAEKALELAMNEADMRGRLEAMGMKANDINNLISATGFRAGYAFSDPSQNVNVVKLGDHYFNTAGNIGKISAAGLTSFQRNVPSTTSPPAPVLPPPSGSVLPPPPGQPAQAVTPQKRPQAAGKPSVNVFNVGGGGQQQATAPTGGGTISLPSPPKNGPDVPFPSPKNPDNFLVFYSRLTYNIIDG